LITVAATVVIVLALVGSYFVFNKDSPKQNPPQITTKQYEIGRATSEPEPAAASDKVRYYANIADTYAGYGEYQKAVEAMLKADSFVTDRTFENGQSLNLGIAKLYKQLGQKDKARDYYQREIDRLASVPDNTEALSSIKKMKDAL
jgi:tetratricopeptide (TPR) repeat protein